MALVDVSTSKVYPKYKPENADQVIATGYYRTKEARGGDYPGFNYVVDDGVTTYALSSCGQLDKIFGYRVQPGDWVVVTYKGKNDIKGGKTAHAFRVQVEKDPSLMKPGLPVTTAAPKAEVGF